MYKYLCLYSTIMADNDGLNISSIIDDSTLNDLMSSPTAATYVSSFTTTIPNVNDAGYAYHGSSGITPSSWFATNSLTSRYNAAEADTQELQVLLTSWNLGHLVNFFLHMYIFFQFFTSI